MSPSTRLGSALLFLRLLQPVSAPLSPAGGWLLERLLLLHAASFQSVLRPLCWILLPALAPAAAAVVKHLSSVLKLLLRDICVLVCWPDTCLLLRSCTELRNSSDFASSVSSSSRTACMGRSAASGGSTTGVRSPLLLSSCTPSAVVAFGVTAEVACTPWLGCPAVLGVAGPAAFAGTERLTSDALASLAET
jgi:hypothetical protein